MAILKKHRSQVLEELPAFKSLEEAQNYFANESAFEHQRYAIEEMVNFEEGGRYAVSLLNDPDTDKDMVAAIVAVLSRMDRKKAPIEAIMDLIKGDNAYIRNLAISLLQNYGDAIKYYIVKFLIGYDRDLRIFAINVLGDVSFAESRELLCELLEKEEDINVAMTAVDYMAEIGEEEDIPLLESLKTRFDNHPYVTFSVDGAIRSIKG